MTKSSKKWIIPIVIVAVIISAVAILLMSGVIGGSSRVPDIVNKNITEAEKILEEAGYTLSVSKTEINDELDENTVLEQTPESGEKLEKGSMVNVTISEKSVETDIPDVKYFSKDLATEVLKNAGFKVEIKTENSSDFADNSVISQNKTGKGRTGSVICITVCDNNTPASNETTKVPNIVKKSKEEAVEILEEDFYFMVSEIKFSDDIEKDKIIAQTPQADIITNKNITIEAVLSRGKTDDFKVIVPNVVRFARAEAKKILEDAELRVMVKEEYSDTVAAGVVISQSIKNGTKVNADTVVIITVSAGKETETESTQTLPVPTKFTTTKKNETTKKNDNQNVTQKPASTQKPTSAQKPTELAGESKYKADFRITTDKKDAKAGDIITVSVKLKTNYRIVAVSVPVIYDARVFEVVGADENKVSSFLEFTGTLTENGYSTNGNYKSPDDMYKKNSNPEYWTDPVRKANNKIAFATWVAMPSMGTVMTSLESEETIVTFKLKVKDNVSDTSGRIYLHQDFIKTASDPQGILFVGRSKSDTISVDSIVQTGQTINLDKASALVVIK